ncbi:hypothetical protein C5G87_25900 [Paenibacillus peoriae]|uniref:TniQ family protein n=1 Tax=Paenibacillus peoriae TaxID=59893 RepID=UPI000CECA28A|nr:TniQ family protein [Paenibacillus peoriae]PPQ46043.1 hypothetical protein C5G87_25900 [Paenibacillus peoriae]
MKTKGFQTLPSRTFYNEGESLFSYLLRTAYNNGISVLLLLNMIRKNEKYLLHKGDIRRIDYYPESVFNLEKLIELTGITLSDVYKSTFTNVLHAFGYCTNGEKARMMKNMLRVTLHFCAQCLEEGLGYNLMWKVEGVDCCLKHNQRLINQCLHCKQEIGYHHIVTIDRCPHCDQSLTDIRPGYQKKRIDNMALQQSLQTNLNQLVQATDLRFEAQGLAQKLLYLMNEAQPVYQADTIKNALQGGYSLAHLLQYARDTISAPKNIRLSFVLKVVHSQSVDINTLSKMEVPTTFMDSLLEGTSIQWTREFACKAPWCKGRGKRNSLISTSSKHVIKSGKKLSHYLVCRECYCEYAFDEKRNLVERTSYISVFDIMSKYNISSMTWPEKEKCFSMNKERIRRASAYFYARQLSKGDIVQGNNKTDTFSLDKFISALRQGEALSNIRFWTIWRNYNQYLLHRYHPIVMKEIFDRRYGEKASVACFE